MNKPKYIPVNIISLIALMIFLLVFAKIFNYTIAYNVTDSLPQKLFLIQEGKIPKKDEYVAFNKKNQFYNKPFIKKIIGTHGDVILPRGNHILITNSKGLTKQAAIAVKDYSLSGQKLTMLKKQVIPQNHYYVHVNHKDSLDSRYQEVGLINKSHIIGKAIPVEAFHSMCFFIITIFLFLISRVFVEAICNGGCKEDKKIFRNSLIIGIIILIFYTGDLFAKDLGIHGKVFEIKETDLAKDIKNKLTKMEESGELQELQKQWQQKSVERAGRPKPVEGITKSKNEREFDHDPSITVSKDIKDHRGRIIVSKGRKVNPLHFQKLPNDLIFIDGDDQEQVNWALKKAKIRSTVIILVKGNIMQLMRDYQTRIYFDQNGYLTKVFGIKAVPAFVIQNGDRLRVKEVVL